MQERHHTHVFDTFRRNSGTVECQRCGHEIEIGALPYALTSGARATPEVRDLLERARKRGDL